MAHARLTLGLLAGVLAAGLLVLNPWSTARPKLDPPATVARVTLLTGEVRDAHGPVPGARVRFKGSPTAVVTDARGRFSLPGTAADSGRVTAWKEGYLVNGIQADASPLRLHLTRLPATDFEPYAWVDPTPNRAAAGNCGNCHAEIQREWAASGHARSVRNRHFLNLYDGTDAHGRRTAGWNLLAEHPDGAGVCTSCHAPTVAFDDPAYDDLRQARGPAAHGVHCDYCHKIAEVENRHFGLTHGRFGLQLLRPEHGQLFFGPLDDVDRGEDAYSSLYQDSRYCASCHEGTVFGVPVYSTYSEWLASPARREGKQCQSCHMTPTGNLTNLAPGKGGLRRDPQTLANHRFFAGSQEEMLRRCLKVILRLLPVGLEWHAEVRVQVDGVGHRVPTGFVDRNLLLVLEAFDPAGKAMPPKAGSTVLPPLAGKSLQGLAGRLFAKQTRDFDGLQPVPFWLAQPEVVDTRLRPGVTDRSSYTFPGPVVRVRLRVVHRRFWEEVALAKGWTDNEIKLVDQSLPVPPGQEVHWPGP